MAPSRASRGCRAAVFLAAAALTRLPSSSEAFSAGPARPLTGRRLVSEVETGIGELRRPQDFDHEGMSSPKFFATVLGACVLGAALTRSRPRHFTRCAAAGDVSSTCLPDAKFSIAGATQALFSKPSAGLRAEVCMFALAPQLLNRWIRPFKPAVMPQKSMDRMPDDDPMSSRVHFGKYAIQATELCWLTNKQLEDARRAITTAMSRSGKVYIRVYPHNAITQRIAESRMGASKGKFESWVAAIKPGVVLFEVDAESEDLARAALKAGSLKLPIKVKFAVKEEGPSMFELEE